MPRVNRNRRTCERKQAWSTFRRRAVAKRVTSKLNRYGDHQVEWFKCACCGCYHVGGKYLPLLDAFKVALRELTEPLGFGSSQPHGEAQ